MKYAIERNYSQGKINKAVEKFRKANLSLFKAQVHVAKEKLFQNKPYNFTIDEKESETLKYNLTIEKIQSEIFKWEILSINEIINLAKQKF